MKGRICLVLLLSWWSAVEGRTKCVNRKRPMVTPQVCSDACEEGINFLMIKNGGKCKEIFCHVDMESCMERKLTEWQMKIINYFKRKLARTNLSQKLRGLCDCWTQTSVDKTAKLTAAMACMTDWNINQTLGGNTHMLKQLNIVNPGGIHRFIDTIRHALSRFDGKSCLQRQSTDNIRTSSEKFHSTPTAGIPGRLKSNSTAGISSLNSTNSTDTPVTPKFGHQSLSSNHTRSDKYKNYPKSESTGQVYRAGSTTYNTSGDTSERMICNATASGGSINFTCSAVFRRQMDSNNETLDTTLACNVTSAGNDKNFTCATVHGRTSVLQRNGSTSHGAYGPNTPINNGTYGSFGQFGPSRPNGPNGQNNNGMYGPNDNGPYRRNGPNEPNQNDPYAPNGPNSNGRYNPNGPYGPNGPNSNGPYGPNGPNSNGPYGPNGPNNNGPYGPNGPNSNGPYGPNSNGPYGPNSNGPYGPNGPNSNGPYGPNGPNSNRPYGPNGPNSNGPYGPNGPNSNGPYGPNGPNSNGPYGPNRPNSNGPYGPNGPNSNGPYGPNGYGPHGPNGPNGQNRNGPNSNRPFGSNGPNEYGPYGPNGPNKNGPYEPNGWNGNGPNTNGPHGHNSNGPYNGPNGPNSDGPYGPNGPNGNGPYGPDGPYGASGPNDMRQSGPATNGPPPLVGPGPDLGMPPPLHPHPPDGVTSMNGPPGVSSGGGAPGSRPALDSCGADSFQITPQHKSMCNNLCEGGAIVIKIENHEACKMLICDAMEVGSCLGYGVEECKEGSGEFVPRLVKALSLPISIPGDMMAGMCPIATGNCYCALKADWSVDYVEDGSVNFAGCLLQLVFNTHEDDIIDAMGVRGNMFKLMSLAQEVAGLAADIKPAECV